jgi:hypothetical protein
MQYAYTKRESKTVRDANCDTYVVICMYVLCA